MKIEQKDLLQAGVHFGHKSEKWNPKMSPFIFAKRSGIHIIDLEKTVEKLEVALDFIKKESAKGKKVLFVGTKRQAQDIVKKAAESCGMPYVNFRWLGGTLTNFPTVINQVRKMVDLRRQKESGELEKFSKKEQAVMKKELERLEKNIGGLEGLKSVPEVIFIIDVPKEHIAIKEAKKVGSKTVAVVDTNANPELIDFVIPGNDDAIKSIEYLSSLVKEAISEAYKENKSEEEDK